MEKEEKDLVHEAVIKYNNACEVLIGKVAESCLCSTGENYGFSKRLQEFEADCEQMRYIMEEYEAYLEEV